MRRHIRQELEQLEKDGEISDDDLDRIEKELEKLTHDVVAEIDTLVGPQGEGAARGLTPLRPVCGLERPPTRRCGECPLACRVAQRGSDT